ncbi:hypothetical protein CEXT_485581 [Caerostris extrusa]|uniref:Uncharacterized protein n=1 Tax=Caerostris extrusa TaxID=172846 RepID=A0AAV4W067_CAEEX|nr:hypothetical protein CEXT_485581 [Caerostris extrusa]
MQCRHRNINNANPSQVKPFRATNANRRVQPSAPSHSRLRAKALLKTPEGPSGRKDGRDIQVEKPFKAANANRRVQPSAPSHSRPRAKALLKPLKDPQEGRMDVTFRCWSVRLGHPVEIGMETEEPFRATNANRRVQPSAPSHSQLRSKALLKPLKDPQEGRIDVTFRCRSVQLDHPVEIGMETTAVFNNKQMNKPGVQFDFQQELDNLDIFPIWDIFPKMVKSGVLLHLVLFLYKEKLLS